ncbi:MAG: HIT family protein [Desulfonatronovibrio sp. MSAO_Bac4]|nr:MAG: HIT family protein [Desulfonatronovibrio sp. MSAO_Bac4]
MSQCIFCQIVQGKVPCVRVYENHSVLAFLDIAPVKKGHTLIIPKKHVVNIMDVSSDIAAELHEVIKKVGKGLLEGLSADGFNLGMNNFEAAGQLVMHAHYHLIPRYKNDGLKLWPQSSYAEDEMNAVAGKISSVL